MKKISRRSFLEASGILAASAALTACGGSNSESKATSSTSGSGSEHEPITLMHGMGIEEFIDVVHAKYPEINIKHLPYGGNNGSWYMKCQLNTGIMPDIYNALLPSMDSQEAMQEYLLDLSGYPFTDNFIPTQIREMEVDGKLYLVPCNYTIFGISYNKTLFDKHGWTYPNSFEELKELLPKIKEAGVNPAITNIAADAYGFQYLCNLADVMGLSTIDGVKWQREFLSGNAPAEEGFGAALDYMQEWIDLGMIEGRETSDAKMTTQDIRYTEKPFATFAEGNTAFFIGIMSRQMQNTDGTGDQYVTMPYLSEDGSNNMVITSVYRYFGINKRLAEPGNEQKLEDALHVMEVIASVEGQEALNREKNKLYTVKDAAVEEGSPFYESVKVINDGHSAPFIYEGWLDIMIPIGAAVSDYADGKITRDEVLSIIDTTKQDALNTEHPIYAHADEEISQDMLVQLVGQAYCEEVGADCALMTQDDYRERGYIQNSAGVCGTMLPTDMDDEYFAIFTPNGRNGTVVTLTLTGAQIKDAMEKGFDYHGLDGLVDADLMANFPYTLVAKEGFALDDATEYQVVVCGATDALKEEGNAVDTGIYGRTALKDYFDKRGNPMHFTAKDIVWN